MKTELLDFFFLRQPNIQYVVAGSVLICIVSALTGCFTFLRKRALVGDAVSHSVLPGVCLAFLLLGEKDPVWFMIGAILTGLLSLMIMEGLSRAKLTRPDTAIALMLSVFFGTGIVLLTYIQHSGNAAQAGLDKYLFGKAASITIDDIKLIAGSSLAIIGLLLVFLRGFYLISFDEEFAIASGFPVKFLRFLLSVLTVWTIAIGIQTTGVVLMAALLITPALAARLWTNSILKMLLIATLFGIIAGYTGAFISYTAPAMPTGPWIVVSVTCIAIFSLTFAPKRGMFSRWRIKLANHRKTMEENILKLFYRIDEKSEGATKAILEEDLVNFRSFKTGQLAKGLSLLRKKGFILEHAGTYTLSASGMDEARRVVRLHRLWELYLQKYLHLNPDHVHDDAEAIEHVITPEIEKLLDAELGFPVKDPHDTSIPPPSEK